MTGAIWIILVAALIFGVWICMRSSAKHQDENFAHEALRSMHTDYEYVDEDFVRRHQDRIMMMVCLPPLPPNVDEGTYIVSSLAKMGIHTGTSKEHLTFAKPLTAKYWNDHYYSDPLVGDQSNWYPGLFSRAYNWEPGYRPAGWSFSLRPGIRFAKSQRNRWIRDNRNFYFINNGPNAI
jgi:hypothetical protein